MRLLVALQCLCDSKLCVNCFVIYGIQVTCDLSAQGQKLWVSVPKFWCLLEVKGTSMKKE